MLNSNRTDRHVATNSRFRVVAQPIERGTGRLGVVSGLFQWCAAGGAAQTTFLAIATVFPRFFPGTVSRPLLPLAASALMTYAFYRTHHLLDERRRSGAWLAALCLATSLPTALTRSGASLLWTGISLVGLGLIASVWKHLDKD
jgi:hypothetical protein